jgi:hypothetical protein
MVCCAQAGAAATSDEANSNPCSNRTILILPGWR